MWERGACLAVMLILVTATRARKRGMSEEKNYVYPFSNRNPGEGGSWQEEESNVTQLLLLCALHVCASVCVRVVGSSIPRDMGVTVALSLCGLVLLA